MTWPLRVAFVALLTTTLLVPHLSSNGFDFPAVTNFWSCLPFCALLLLPFVDHSVLRRRLFCLDMVALLSFVVAIGLEQPGRIWPVVLVYPSLIYLGARMIAIARIGRSADACAQSSVLQLALSRTWLLAGIVVLSLVHVSWAVQGNANTDVAFGGTQGAQQILDGRALYETPDKSSIDPHIDTYGPVNYEAYVPFALVLDGRSAARATTMFFDLLTALLLFLLGRRVRGITAGVLLAYGWLAFPFTLYEDALGFNDSIVAAALVATMLVAQSPVRRGAVYALTVWTKLSPLALLPLLAGQNPPAGRSARRGLSEFLISFLLVSAVAFLPVVSHDSLGEFVTRTFGFQADRPPANSLWSLLQGNYLNSQLIADVSHVAHGLLVAFTGAFAIVLFRVPRRQDLIGLAAASAAVLIAVQMCLGYYSFSYILWFAPLVLVALVLGCFSNVEPAGPSLAREDPHIAIAPRKTANA